MEAVRQRLSAVASAPGVRATDADPMELERFVVGADRARLDRLVAVAGSDAGKRRGGSARRGEVWWVRSVITLLAPLWAAAIAAAALARLGRGRLPLLVLQERAGLDRARFLLPKIATMSLPSNRLMWGGLVEVSSEAGLEPATLAPVDRWLRHTGLDELPQLALIVTGRMRLVGPRPATFGELEQMVCIAARDPRCAVGVDSLAPGVVGVWQVLERHGYSLAERQALDRFMIDHWSPALQRAIVAMASGQAVRRLVGRS